MKKLLLGICYSLIGQIVFSQQITGKVVDAQSKAPIPSASVEIDGQPGTLTNDKGEFRLSKLAAGTYNLHISSIGFKTNHFTVSPGKEIQVFTLESWNLFMQPVEVKAIRAGDKAPFTKSNLTKKEIEQVNLGQDLPFLLNQTPSVVVNSDAGNGVGYTGLRIRGTDATRINMTINGIPYNDAESQGLFFVNLPDIASSVNNIQIQRGVGTSSNGAGAFGATINFSTNEVNTTPYAEINNSFGSFNTLKHTVKAGTGIINDHFTVDARLSKVRSDGFIDRASSDLSSYFLSAAYLSEKSSIRLNITSGKEKTYQAWYGITEADLVNNRTVNYAGTEKPGSPYDNETDNYKQDHYQLFFNHQFSPSITFNTALFLTNGKGYYEQYKASQAYSKYGLPNFITGNDTLLETDLIRQLWLDNKYYGQIISLMYKSGQDQLSIGGGWNQYDGNHFGEIIWAKAGIDKNYRWYYHKAKKNDINLYTKYQRVLNERFSLFADLQYRRVGYKINGFRDNPTVSIDETYNFFNPKFGVSYNWKDIQGYLSYSLGQKEPNRDDFEAGQQQLPRPEKLHDIELGLEKKNSHYSFGATLFYMKYKDQLVLTGRINDVGAYTRSNIPNSYRAGVELQSSSLLTKWLQVSGNLTISTNKVKNFTEYYDDYDNGGQKSIAHGTTDIAYSPNVVAGIQVSFLPAKNFTISLPGKYVSRQYLDNTSQKSRSLNPYYVQDARISYSLHNFIFKEISFLFQVNNVFSKKYEPNGYTFSYQYGGAVTTENYYFPMASLNLLGAINIKL
jgi:iron complex outermembrane recepter protein